MTGATSGLGRAGRRVDRGAGRARLHRRARRGAHRARPRRSPPRRLRGRGRPRRPLVPRGDRAAFASRFAERHDRLDVLVLNAGALTHAYTVTGEGNELTPATHVLSPFLLTRALRLSARGVGTVARDRGGIRRHVHPAARRRRLDPEPAAYDGTKTRAASGRRSCWPRSGRDTCSRPASPSTPCTPAGPTPLRTALPGFTRIVGPLLRTPEEGADTIVWLAAAPDASGLSGLFFLDRRARAKHRLRRTRRPTRPARRRDSGGSARSARPRSRPVLADQPPDPAAASAAPPAEQPLDRVMP